MLAIYFIILYITYSVFKDYSIEENEAKLQDLLMHNKALHTYVEKTLKPVIYDLKEQGFIEKDFFDPKILSFTYMSRNIMQEYNKQRIANNVEPIKYKLASNNPRNILNKADDTESDILKMFSKEDIKKYHHHINKDDKEYILYAMPVAKNAKSCMQCHGNPKDAPQDLIDIYGDKAGFNEQVGQTRAFISVTLPYYVELNKMQNLFKMLALFLLVLFIAVYYVVYHFIKKINDKDNKLLDQANKDALTNILNRHMFNQDINELKNTDGVKNFLMIIDIDHFKKINDTYGHQMGDKVLRQISSVISGLIRQSDRFYRIGGEEFAIISQQRDIEDAKSYAQRIRQSIKSTEFESIHTVTISIGITQQKQDDTEEKLFNRADEALYHAKADGRDTIKVI